MDEAEIARRMPVWMALSRLFLDTELDAGDHRAIRAVLRASGYGSARLRDILYREVAPVLCHNLLSVAGEWAGWTEADLRALLLPRIVRARGAPRRSLVVALLLRGYLASCWQQVDPGGEAPPVTPA